MSDDGDGNLSESSSGYYSSYQERQNMSTYSCGHLVLVQHLLYINTHNL